MNALQRYFAVVPLISILGQVPCRSAQVDLALDAQHPDRRLAVTNAIQAIQRKYAPDPGLAIFSVGVASRARELVLTGEVDRAEAKIEVVQAVQRTGAKVVDHIKLLPDERLGDEVWGIGTLSVANGRLGPQHKAEMGTQVLMGEVIRVWKRSSSAAFSWYYTQTGDGYLSWLQKGTFVRCTRPQADAWVNSPRLIVTAFEDRILEQPQASAEPVSDVVMCDLVRKTGEDGDWYKVELPDQRAGFLPKRSAQDFAAWKAARSPTPENIERSARMFIGRPYSWGCNSPKGFDCSGFTKTVFFLNGISLLRDSSKQARQGSPVPLDSGLSQLRKGDLLFFGRRPRDGGPVRIVHVGIYLGNKLFIHSSERVHISSLDPDSPIADENRIQSLVRARRVLPGN